MAGPPGKPLTGRTRRRTTTRRVKLAEHLSRIAITAGGYMTIVAVLGIMLFLLSVMLPLFSGVTVEQPVVEPGLRTASVAALGMDDDQLVAWVVEAGGAVRLVRLDDGSELDRRVLFEGQAPTSIEASSEDGRLAFGFADGSVQVVGIGIGVEQLFGDGQAPAEAAELLPGGVAASAGGLLQRTPAGPVRRLTLAIEPQPRQPSADESAVVLAEHRTVSQTSGSGRELLAVLHADGSLVLSDVRTRRNILTGKLRTTSRETRLPYSPRPDHGTPAWLLLSELGDTVSLAWKDGYLVRFDTRDLEAPEVAEEVVLTTGRDARITALRYLLGRSTLIVGDSAGRVRGWFGVRSGADAGSDGLRLTLAHDLPARDAAVTALAASDRDRRFVAGYADGVVRVFQMTSGQVLAELSTGQAAAVTALCLATRGDGVLASTEQGAWHWRMRAEHPEATLGTLFAPVWYEGLPGPQHVWQSSGGTDDFEPKLGMWPLVFGTLKATFYSLVFSIPVALLAAVYTSEFLPRAARARVKQTVEMMASLPSVVLGFLAALVLAPFVEQSVPALLLACLTVPVLLLLGAYLWQFLPQDLSVRLSGWPRLLAIIAALPLALWLAAAGGAGLERVLFAGDMRAWLDGQVGSGFGGWAILGLPPVALAVTWFVGRVVGPAIRARSIHWSRRRAAAVDLARFAGALVLAGLLCWLLASGLEGAGFDPRGGFLGTYVQRNALIVGFMMGFAVIPIIYTLAEDALSAVPDHLRAASLAAGATSWQTATRVIVPTAMSGIFSAVMIGLGRAVGETMVVLMAAGNTPVLDINVFNGFRTLSATIAVELPEAVRDSTLYRVLFLAALTLFAMTFLINTLAELVRLRFRQRAYEL